MARFLLACYPIAGHLHPHLAVAHALKTQGHEVAFYTGAAAQSQVEREGFVFFPFHPEMDARLTRIWQPAEGGSLAEDLPIMKRAIFQIGAIRATLAEWFLGTVPQQIDDLRALLARWQPDVLVSDISLWGPILVLSETAAIPVAAFCVLFACPLPGPDAPTWGRGLPPPHTWPARLRSKLEQVIQDWVLSEFRERASALRQSYGLAPLAGPVMAHAGTLPLFLLAGAPELDYDRRDLPPTVHYAGPCLWHRSAQEAPPAWLLALPKDRPVVHVTEGTVHTRQPLVLRAAAQGLGNLPMEVIMSTGKARRVEELDLGPLAANIRVEQYVSHGDLFPHTAVVVTTGGPGTVLTALAAGVPLVIVPTGWDHIENAQRIVYAGVGVSLPPQKCTAATLAAAVQKILADPAYRRNAQRMAEALQRQGGPDHAAALLEGLLHAPKPPVAPTPRLHKVLT